MWELVSFAKAHLRRTCLESLTKGPKTPAAIAKASKEDLPHISRALRELADKGLVECLTPSASKNRIYQITPTGQEILSKLQEMEQ